LRWLGRDASSSRAGGCKSRGGSTQDRVERPDIDDQCGQREDGGTKIDAVDEEAGVFFSRGPYRRQRGWAREGIEDSKKRRSSWVEMDGRLGWSIETEDAREEVNPRCKRLASRRASVSQTGSPGSKVTSEIEMGDGGNERRVVGRRGRREVKERLRLSEGGRCFLRMRE
jgi:hypothetical protein